jgi:hypothetical protein
VAKRRKSSVNKAQAIRDYVAAHPEARGVDVVADLKGKGIKVSSAQVSNIKTSGKKKKPAAGGKKRGPKKRLTRPEDVRFIGDKGLEVLDAALVMLEHVTVDYAKSMLDRLSSRKPR